MTKEAFFENIKTLKLLAKHEVGQNFLINPDAAEKIVASLEIKEDERVLEIGCGAGSLSYFISLSGADADLIDIDEGLLTKVKLDFEDNENIHPLLGNAMKYDYSCYDKIIGNLPYYITSGIIEKALLGAGKCSRMVFMVQKEAAARILSGIGSKEYSPLNILLLLSGKAKRLFNVDRASFAPAPHVDSTVFAIDLFKDRDITLLNKVYAFAGRMFLQRRKTIFNNLKQYLGNAEKAKSLLSGLAIDLNKRPEELKPEDYVKMVEGISAL